MPTTYLCTTGTSIAQGIQALRQYQSKETTWEDEAEDLKSGIRERLAGLDLSTGEGRNRASAEINSLNRMGLGPADRVVLFVTDTADGRVCAEAITSALERDFGLAPGAVEVNRIPGLQVRNAARLRTEGLPGLVESALRYIQNPRLRYGGEIILNPTGGFKGVLPFLTVLGMLFRLRTVYLFEFSDEVISLPPLPVTFDLTLYQRALPALEMLQRETVAPAERFFRAIEDFREAEADLFSGFIEQEGTQVTLSTLALVFLATDTSPVGRQLRVSRAVKGRLGSADSVERAELERCLVRVSHPLWRMMHGHRFSGTDLSVFGEGGGPRIAGFFEGEIFHVTSIHLITRGGHDAYEKELYGRKRADFAGEAFEEWVPATDLEGINQRAAAAKESALREKEEEIAQLKEKLKEAKKPERRNAKDLQGLEEAARSNRVENGELRRENAKLKERVERLERENAKLRG